MIKISLYRFFIAVTLCFTLGLASIQDQERKSNQSAYTLSADYTLKNDQYDQKDIAVYHICKPGKTIENSDVITIWVHGYADTHRQTYKYIKEYRIKKRKIRTNLNYIISSDCVVTFDFADSGKIELVFKHKDTSMAQDNEIHRLNEVITHVKELINPTADIVLAGMSRGASTIITTMAQHDHPEVKALILESPFGSIEDVISKTLASMIFGRYNKNGIRPIDVVGKLPKDLAILIVASHEDQRVPVESTISLYDRLKGSDHNHTHLQLLDHGKHSKLLASDDGSRYQNVMHAFNKFYNLPHDSVLAEKGAADFLNSQSTEKELRNSI